MTTVTWSWNKKVVIEGQIERASEAVTQRCPVKKVFLEISQNSH